MFRPYVLVGLFCASAFACGGGGCGGVGENEGAPCDASLYDRTCLVDADCGVLNHQIDCCGNQVIIGLALNGLSGAQQGEATCVAAAPVCQCATRQPVAQDGQEVFEGGRVTVHCRVGRCVTTAI